MIKSGDKQALEYLIDKYRELVNMKVTRYFIIGAEKDDIIQEGLIGLYKAIKNYSLKKPYTTYEKMFRDIKEKYDLKGQIKNVSNVMCEFIITSGKEFFEEIAEDETKRYFKTAYSICGRV